MTAAAGVAAIAALLVALWLLWRGDAAYEHAMLHETDAKTNPDRIAAVATNLIGALRCTQRAYRLVLCACVVQLAGTGVAAVLLLVSP